MIHGPDVPRFWLVLCMTAGPIALVGLVAIWSSSARGHWFLRAAAVGALLVLLAIVPAFDLVLIFLAEATTVALALIAGRLWRAPREDKGIGLLRRWHFSVADLLLLCAAVAAVTLLARKTPESARYWAGIYFTWGAACGCAVLAAFFSVNHVRRWPVRAAVIACVPLLAAIVPANLSGSLQQTRPFIPFFYQWGCHDWFWYPLLPAVAALVALCLWQRQAAWSASRLSSPTGQSSAGKSGRQALRSVASWLVLAALSVAIVVLPGVAYFQMLFPASIRVDQLPNPNGYLELARLGDELAKTAPSDLAAVWSAGISEVEKFVRDNQERLQAVRAALAHESAVPLDREPLSSDSAAAAAFGGLQRALVAEARVAEA